MSNHFHLVLHIDTNRSTSWTSEEIIDRWLKLYSGPDVVQRYKAGLTLTKIEEKELAGWEEKWRARLADLSWYMRCLNETIARMANKEDECTGRFWEGRFRSQALLDEAALISCMAYVDLNPIRAQVCKSLDQSDFTSIQERLKAASCKSKKTKQDWLMPMASGKTNAIQELPFGKTDYFVLVDWTGRMIRSNKRGAIPSNVRPILQRINVNQDNWVNNTKHFERRFYRVLGRLEKIKKFARQADQKWLHGVAQAKAFYL